MNLRCFYYNTADHFLIQTTDMGFAYNAIKSIRENRTLQTKARMQYRDRLSSMSSSNPLQYNKDFEKKYSPSQLAKMQKEVQTDLRNQRIWQYVYSVTIVICGIWIIIELCF